MSAPLELPRRKAAPISLRVTVLEERADGYAGTVDHLYVVVSDGMEDDGRWWRHLSVSRHDRKMPTYDDLRRAKELTIGDRIAIQVFPPAARHIDIAGRLPRPVEVLHLWAPDDDCLPDFGRRGTL